VQIPVFEAQLALAAELNVPVVIHSRESDDDTLAILRNASPKMARKGIMHCFPGGAAFAEECLALGFHISFAGNMTFPKAEKIREAASIVPLDRILVETDAPYLAPKPVRGKRCIPQYVEHTARALADLKGVSFDEIAAATVANAKLLFSL
jgi:TatD DNase family protein